MVMSRSRSGFFYEADMEQKNRMTFYVDGFNFYYGLKRAEFSNKKWGNAYWINLVKLFEGFLSPHEIIEKVIYFTASPLSTSKNSRQSAFLNANRTLNQNRFEVVRGKYLEKHIICPYCKGDISRPEEKKTDVNISIRMIQDCMHNITDAITLVSADTDLMPPLELIRSEFPNIKLKILFPPSNYSNEIESAARAWKSKVVLMKNNYQRFENAIMSDIVKSSTRSYTIPAEWKKKQILK